MELRLVYRAVAAAILRRCSTPIVLIDETEIRPGVCALTASLAFDGRGVAIYAIVRSKKYVTSRRCRRSFLRRLEQVLPDGAVPVLVTDAWL